MKKLFLMVILSLCAFTVLAEKSPHVTAKNSKLWLKIKTNVIATWNSPTRDLYMPINTWHNRWFYDRDKIDRYNERPWGIGYGVSRYDYHDNWHAIYAMEFQDSHDKLEPILGYGYQKVWRLNNNPDWRFGFGFTAALTMRHEYRYIPLPLILPMMSFEYKKVAVQSAYVPGTQNNGNVLFTWFRWEL